MGGTHTVENGTECAQTHSHTHTHRQTDRQTEVKEYIRQFHSVHLADIIRTRKKKKDVALLLLYEAKSYREKVE